MPFFSPAQIAVKTHSKYRIVIYINVSPRALHADINFDYDLKRKLLKGLLGRALSKKNQISKHLKIEREDCIVFKIVS